VEHNFSGFQDECPQHLECFELHIFEGIHQQHSHVVHNGLDVCPDEFVLDLHDDDVEKFAHLESDFFTWFIRVEHESGFLGEFGPFVFV